MKPERVLCIGFIVTALLLFSNQTFAQNGPLLPTFVGTVIDKAEGAAIPRAHIWIHEDSGKASFSVQPDRSGNFSIHLPNGYYDVLFSASGFAPFCKKIWVRSGKPITLQVDLGPDIDTSQVD
jgi:hypothetical protein